MNDLMTKLRSHLRRDRLIGTAVELINVPSRTGEAGAVSDRLGAMLRAEGFAVERPTGGYNPAPAVAVRFESGRPGKTLQYNGHLDTVHIPYVPAKVADGLITGSGASDMKGGTAAAIEALRIVRDSGLLARGSVLLTAHDLHESPWGDGRQLNQLIRDGYVGDAVLLPEPLSDRLPVIGRGLAVWKIDIRRAGPPVHEVMRPREEPSVISAAAKLVAELDRLAESLAAEPDDFARDASVHPGKASVFIGQMHAGQIYNEYPQVCHLEGTRRWLPGTDHGEVERDLRDRLERVAGASGTSMDCEWVFTRDAFALDLAHPIVNLFQSACTEVRGQALPLGAKPFVDDGNSFWSLAGVPAITHGPRAGGQHTTSEWVEIDDLERLALIYAATAIAFCSPDESRS